jgi:hypothetical protein
MLVALTTIVFMAIAAGVVMAAPGASERATGDLSQSIVNLALPTTTIAPTSSFTHPVALAISKFFSVSVTYTQVMSMHQSGLGFGEIARAYMMAQSSGKTVDELLAMRESGMGWGQIMKELSFKPGGKNLGAIMSGHGVKDKEPPPGKPDDKDKDKGKPDDKPDKSNRPECPGQSCDAHGKSKSKP